MNSVLPKELAEAARNLEERFQLLRVPARRVALGEWASLEPSVLQTVPPWLMHLLSDFALAGGVLEYRDRSRTFPRLFSLFGPDQMRLHLQEGAVTRRALDHGYVPFANESDGNVWVAPLGGPPGPVFLLELADWDGGRPNHGNGLVFAGSRLEFLLASMAVSEASYYELPHLPRYVMWYGAP